MDIKSLTRDAAKVHACLRELPDGRLVAVKDFKIMIPVRHAERGLADIGTSTFITGICAYIAEDKYFAISLVNAKMQIDPTSTMKTLVNGEEYFEFYFRPGSTVIVSLDLVKIDTLVYRIYDEIFSKGRVPWYIGYEDLGDIFDTALKHAGARIGTNHEVTELIVSIISRSAKDRHLYYRQVIKTLQDLITSPPAFIPMRSVIYAATNTTNKLAGSHYKDGVVSALVSPSDRTERLEGLLRM